jgi:hypothetical protein
VTPLAEAIRETLCLHLDGAAVVPAMAALARHRILERLRRGPADVDSMAAASDVRAGPLAVALRVLALQGWVVLEVRRGGSRRVRPTASGARALGLRDAYVQALALMRPLRELEALLDGARPTVLETFATAHRRRWNVDSGDAELDRRAVCHCEGAVLGPLLFVLERRGVFAGLDLTRRTLSLDGAPPGLGAILDALPAHWARRAGRRVTFSEAGMAGARAGAGWWHVAAYLELLRTAPALLAGADPAPVDRPLSIGASGQVFARLVRPAFLRLLLPLFDGAAVARQPRWLIDVGSGDGTMLRGLWQAVARQTARGRALDRAPLLAVGVEHDPLARTATARTLAAAGIPHVVVEGDVDDPADLARRLAPRGIALEGALCVSKSVIHDRAWRPPTDTTALARRVSHTRAVAVADDGSLIPPAALEQNLVEHFARWRAAVPRFGLVVADAHCVPPAVAARHVGRTLMSLLEATHGWSRQYLVEADVFRRAATEAGFAVRGRTQLGAAAMGHDYVSVTRLVPT